MYNFFVNINVFSSFEYLPKEWNWWIMIAQLLNIIKNHWIICFKRELWLIILCFVKTPNISAVSNSCYFLYLLHVHGYDPALCIFSFWDPDWGSNLLNMLSLMAVEEWGARLNFTIWFEASVLMLWYFVFTLLWTKQVPGKRSKAKAEAEVYSFLETGESCDNEQCCIILL